MSARGRSDFPPPDDADDPTTSTPGCVRRGVGGTTGRKWITFSNDAARQTLRAETCGRVDPVTAASQPQYLGTAASIWRSRDNALANYMKLSLGKGEWLFPPTLPSGSCRSVLPDR